MLFRSSSPASPVRPDPPKPDRPVLHALGKLARTAARWGLWVTLVGEDAPVIQSVADPEEATRRERENVRSNLVDASGHPVIRHGEDW